MEFQITPKLPGLFFFLLFPLFFSSFLFSAEAGEVEEIDAPELYRFLCSQCHGLEGKGDGPNSTPDMAVNPSDHTSAAFMTTKSDEQLEKVISAGGTGVAKSPLMPAWKATLTKGEVKGLVGYLRELCNCEFEGLVSQKKLRRVDLDFK
jgi:cytochrome c oxidase cbb3-type subunit 3